MTAIEQQIIDTWSINNRVNIMLLENIPEEAMKATLSKRGGRDIARQFAHVNNLRVTYTKSLAKKLGMKLIDFEKDESPERKKLIEAFELSGKAMEKLIDNGISNDGNVMGFKRGLIPMLGYFISHEGHHRGSILLTMKQCGFPLNDNMKWGIWEWNKI
ncbi:MAG: hypothetical protein HZB41_00955 [Ignavibacteriae bacterium]|nr:hypothetical protein [Ignavibacteriota bacterium]